MRKLSFTLPSNGFKSTVRLFVLLALFVCGTQIAQAQISKPTNELETVQYEIQQITSWLGTISPDLSDHPKTIFYNNKIAFLQAVEQDMLAGKSYGEAIRTNDSLNPESPNFTGIAGGTGNPNPKATDPVPPKN